MRYEILTLAVAVLLAVGASGAVAVPMPTTDTSPAPDAQLADYTVDVVDPDDRLTDGEVAELRRLAWSADGVRRQFEDTGTVHFHVQAVGDSLEVYVATNESEPPRVVADVALDEETVTDVTVLNDVMTADAPERIEVVSVNGSAIDNGSTVTLGTASEVTTLTAENSTTFDAVTLTVAEENKSTTFRTEADN